MKRFLLVLAVAGAGACNKPSADDCRRAIVNMRSILNEGAGADTAYDVEGEIRRCRGGSSKEAVACAIKARTSADLDACNFRGGKRGAARTDAPKAESPRTETQKTEAPPAESK